MYKLLILPALAFLMISCGSDKLTEEETREILLPIAGTYRADLPCKDCENLLFQLRLNYDMTYKIMYVYQGRNRRVETEDGKYTLESRNLITLNKPEGEYKYFQIEPDWLRLLDENAEQIKGPNSDWYILKPISRGQPDQDAKVDAGNPTPRGDAMANKWEMGVDMYAIGADPMWALDVIEDSVARMRVLDGPSVSIPIREISEQRTGNNLEFSYAGNEGSLAIKMTLGEGCMDTQYHERYPYNVEVLIRQSGADKEQTYNGCGRFVADPALSGAWKVKSVNGRLVNESDFSKGAPLLQLYSREGKLEGSDGCNTLFGYYISYRNLIKVGDIARTKMACPNDGISNQVYDFINGKELTYKIEETVLTLKNASGDVMTLNK